MDYRRFFRNGEALAVSFAAQGARLILSAPRGGIETCGHAMQIARTGFDDSSFDLHNTSKASALAAGYQ